MERHEDIRERLTDYALGELPAAAREQVDAHLAGCPECEAEARALSLAFQAIGSAETPLAPPAHLKAKVLASLDAGRRPAVTPMVPPVEAARRARGLSPAWLALAAMALLVVGGALAISRQRASQLEQDLRRAEADVARLSSDASTVATQADLAVAILTATDMRRIDLAGAESSRNATARAYWSGAKGLLIVADRLPTPPPGRTYQVWLIGSASAGPVSAGLIDGRREGRGMLIVAPPAGVAGNALTVAVTDEPDGGRPAPTGSKHLVGSL